MNVSKLVVGAACCALPLTVLGGLTAVGAAVAASSTGPRLFAETVCQVSLDGEPLATEAQRASLDHAVAHDGQQGMDALDPSAPQDTPSRYTLLVADDNGIPVLGVFTLQPVEPNQTALAWQRSHTLHDGSTWWPEGIEACWPS